MTDKGRGLLAQKAVFGLAVWIMRITAPINLLAVGPAAIYAGLLAKVMFSESNTLALLHFLTEARSPAEIATFTGRTPLKTRLLIWKLKHPRLIFAVPHDDLYQGHCILWALGDAGRRYIWEREGLPQ